MSFIFIFNFVSSLDLCLNFKTLFFKFSNLLYQHSVLFSEGEVLSDHVLQLRAKSVDVVVLLSHHLLQFVVLVLNLHLGLNLLLVAPVQVVQLLLQRTQLQKLTFLVQFHLLHLLDFSLLLGQFV